MSKQSRKPCSAKLRYIVVDIIFGTGKMTKFYLLFWKALNANKTRISWNRCCNVFRSTFLSPDITTIFEANNIWGNDNIYTATGILTLHVWSNSSGWSPINNFPVNFPSLPTCPIPRSNSQVRRQETSENVYVDPTQKPTSSPGIEVRNSQMSEATNSSQRQTKALLNENVYLIPRN